MCGRFASKATKQSLAKQYQARKVTAAEIAPSHNIAPTETAPIVFEDEDNERVIELASFGIPITRQGKTFPLLNAQSESFARWTHILSRRCIIPADGFYEWAKEGAKEKQPYYFSPNDGLFSFAGLWRPVASGLAFTILTTPANDLVKPIHDRMPVILGHNTVPLWLSAFSDNKTLSSLLEPYPAGLMQAWKVGQTVNYVKNKGEECINPL